MCEEVKDQSDFFQALQEVRILEVIEGAIENITSLWGVMHY